MLYRFATPGVFDLPPVPAPPPRDDHTMGLGARRPRRLCSAPPPRDDHTMVFGAGAPPPKGLSKPAYQIGAGG